MNTTQDQVTAQDIRNMSKVAREAFESGVSKALSGVAQRAAMRDYEERR